LLDRAFGWPFYANIGSARDATIPRVKITISNSISMTLAVTTAVPCTKSCTGRFIMFSAITNIYNKKSEGPTLMELFTATGKLKKF
jgi:hypothetical protein